MTLSTEDFFRILLALSVLLLAAHALGFLFARFRQPRVIGEILGGILLGPTLVGTLLPAQQTWLFPDSGAPASVLAAVYQLGLLLLMFSAGAEVRSTFRPGETRTVALVTVSGILLPLGAGFFGLRLVDPGDLQGPAGNPTAFALVFAIAIAVTSIPVISRIMLDLGILETPFARIVLAVAVLEDILLYVLLAIALGLVQGQEGDAFGVPALFGIGASQEINTAYHVLVTMAFFGLSLILGPRLFRAALAFRYNLLKRSNPIAFQLVFMLALTGIAVFLGVVPIFGAFLAGVAVGTASGQGAVRARAEIKDFAFAFFIPVYFGIVGLRLDLLREFDVLFFLIFLAFACAAKSLSVYLGSRLAGETALSATNLAVALNARGGPGIVLASVAFDARIINEEFYSSLVMLAILTSLLAGSWLERIVKSGRPLRPERAPSPAARPGARRRQSE